MPKTRNVREPTWEEAIERVLRSSDGPQHYAVVSERILSEGIKATLGATPAQTVASRLSTSISQGNSPFLRVSKGVYGLRSAIAVEQVPAPETQSEPESETGALRAFGMFWRRDKVMWGGGARRLLGRQGSGANSVDFADQVGVYLLHDRDRVIYVGRADDTLLARLFFHTKDRLEGRWDRFSWFGLKGVNDQGVLSEASPAWTHKVVVDTMEALLIEALEPPLNRKRGDGLAAVEYQQAEDPHLEKAQQAKLLAEMSRRAGLTS